MAKHSHQEEYFSCEPTILVKGIPTTFEVFLFLPLNDRIILFRPIGSIITNEDLAGHLKKGLKHLHIKARDRELYLKYLHGDKPAVSAEPDNVAPNTHEEKVIPSYSSEPPKPTVVTTTTETAKVAKVGPPVIPTTPADKIAEGLMSREEEKRIQGVKEGKDLIKKILEAAPGADPTMKKMVDNPITEHATMVAIYSVLFAMGIGKNDQLLLQDLIIASFMHDIGITQVLPEVLFTPELKRNEEQSEEFHHHVNLGLELLNELEYKPSTRVLKMLSEHHEKFNGQGYPNKRESFKLDENVQILGLADLLDSICRGYYDGEMRVLADGLAVIQTIEKQTTFPQYFNPDLFKRVRSWLQISGGTEFMETATNAVKETKAKMSNAA